MNAPLSVLNLLKKMVQYESLSLEEEAICSFMEQYAQSAGLPTFRQDNSVCFWIGEGPQRLLLNSHLDVVPASNGHPYDPFTPTESAGLLYGRGTADAKASGAAMTTALLQLAAEGWQPQDGQVMVALTQCEETEYEHNGMRALRAVLPKPDAALVGEPTNLVPVVAQKGLLILRADACGRSAHAARAHLGDNAIEKAARDIARLQQLSFTRSDPWLGRPTLNVTMIEGGSARNVIPDRCTFYLDIRSTPAYTHEEITAQVAKLVESDITVHSGRIIPVATDISESIVRACLKVIPGSTPSGSPTASDWIFLSDVPTVKIGPGASEQSHTPTEQVSIAELEDAVGVYKHVIRGYFAGAA
ncbi:MAG: M20/M25/M40 family metallo-hydrolase [Bacteroidota bacterium]|nr:M20/M25/M40 family metallo-hydrolase [Bacteroidota bacterium]